MSARMSAAIVLASVAVVTGCGIERGIVDAKGYDPSYVYYTTTCVAIGNNACAVPVMTPNIVPECWRLDLRDAEDTGSVCVDRPVWDGIDIGERYEVPS